MTGLKPVFTIVFSMFFTVVASADGVAPNDLPARENFKIFLLAGQSNMAGRGEVTEADKKVHPRVLMLGKDGNWQYAVDPIHYDKKVAGAGLGRSFGIELVKQNEKITIGLVPAACGGSPIASWEPGAYFDKTRSHPYDDAISRARRAMQDGTLAGILWHQGESDAKTGKSAVYKDNLVKLVRQFRKDLNSPELPFIIGQLGQFEKRPWTPDRLEVNQAHIAVAEEIPFAGFVSSDGLSSKTDNTHFNTQSLQTFGQRYARKYLQVIGEDH